MIIIFVLIPVSIVAATIFLTAFIWAVRSGQYDDTCTPAMRLLSEEPGVPTKAPVKAPEQKVPTERQ